MKKPRYIATDPRTGKKYGCDTKAEAAQVRAGKIRNPPKRRPSFRKPAAGYCMCGQKILAASERKNVRHPCPAGCGNSIASTGKAQRNPGGGRTFRCDKHGETAFGLADDAVVGRSWQCKKCHPSKFGGKTRNPYGPERAALFSEREAMGLPHEGPAERTLRPHYTIESVEDLEGFDRDDFAPAELDQLPPEVVERMEDRPDLVGLVPVRLMHTLPEYMQREWCSEHDDEIREFVNRWCYEPSLDNVDEEELQNTLDGEIESYIDGLTGREIADEVHQNDTDIPDEVLQDIIEEGEAYDIAIQAIRDRFNWSFEEGNSRYAEVRGTVEAHEDYHLIADLDCDQPEWVTAAYHSDALCSAMNRYTSGYLEQSKSWANGGRTRPDLHYTAEVEGPCHASLSWSSVSQAVLDAFDPEQRENLPRLAKVNRLKGADAEAAEAAFEALPHVLTFADGTYLAGPIPFMPGGGNVGRSANDRGILWQKFGSSRIGAPADALGVCVAEGMYGYPQRIERGQIAIYGVFRPNGKALFCIEATLARRDADTNKDGQPIVDRVESIEQIKGRGNRLPGYASSVDSEPSDNKFDEVQKAVDVVKHFNLNPRGVHDLRALPKFLASGKVKNPRRRAHLRVRNPEAQWHCSWCKVPMAQWRKQHGGR